MHGRIYLFHIRITNDIYPEFQRLLSASVHVPRLIMITSFQPKRDSIRGHINLTLVFEIKYDLELWAKKRTIKKYIKHIKSLEMYLYEKQTVHVSESRKF